MRAVLVRQFGDPEHLQVEDVPQQQCADGEALVKILAAGINPSDVKNVQGAMAGTTLPRIPGRDFAGVVVSGPSTFQGHEVWGTGGDIGFTRDGSHAEYIVIPAAALIAKPANLSFENAGAAGLTFVTAWSAMVSAARVGEGDTALIVGAAGGVGSAAVQIARLFGAKVIAAVRGSEQEEQARELGATETIDTRGKNLVDEVRAQTGGRGAGVVFDTTGHLFAESIEAAGQGGRVCVISAPQDSKAEFNLRSLYRKELRVMGTDSRRLDVTACSGLLAQMIPGFEQGKLSAVPPHPYPLDRAAEAYAKVMNGSGRFCLVPNS